MKKIIWISLAVVLALGAAGVGYAAWTDTVTVDGTVTTGSVCIEFARCDLLDEFIPGSPPDSDGKPENPGGDYPTAYPDYNALPGFEANPDQGGAKWWRVDKNVGWGEQLITDDPTRPGDRDLLKVWLHNTYPCYFNRLTFYIHNCGTIPVIVSRVWVDGIPIGPGEFVQFDFNGDGADDFELHWGNSIGTQAEPSDELETSLWFHVLQPAPQGQTDTQVFNITIEAVQWNEY